MVDVMATGIMAVFMPATDGEGLLIGLGERAADSSVLWQPLWQAFEIKSIANNPPAVASCNGQLYAFYASAPGDTQYLFYNTFNGTSWSGQNTVEVAQTTTGPGATTFNNQAYLFWQGCSMSLFGFPPSGQLFYTIMGQGYDWQIASGQTISGYSQGVIMSNCPSAVVFNDALYVFYQGPGLEGQLWYTYSTTGAVDTWSSSAQVPGTVMSTSPAAVVFTNGSSSNNQPELYVFYQGEGNNGQLWYNVLDMAGNWAGSKQVQGVTISGVPGGAVYNDAIYVLYEGGGNSGQFWYISSSDGSTWSTPNQVAPIGISASPSLAVFDSQIYCMMQGRGNDSDLWYTAMTPGSPCGFMTKVNAVALSWCPGIATFGDQIYCFYQGDNNSGYLYYLTYGENGWGPSIELQGSAGLTGSPAAIEFNNQLYVFYQGGAWAGNLHYQNSSDGSQWSSQMTVSNLGMSGWPAPVVFNNKLYVFHEGEKNSNSLWYDVLDTSGNWAGDTQMNLGSVSYCNCTGSNQGGTTAPAAISFNGTLYVFYLGNGGAIFYSASGDGSGWSAPVQVSTTIIAQCAVALAQYDNGSGNQLYCVYQNGTSGDLYFISTSNPASSWSSPVLLGNTITTSPPGSISELADTAISCIQMF